MGWNWNFRWKCFTKFILGMCIFNNHYVKTNWQYLLPTLMNKMMNLSVIVKTTTSINTKHKYQTWHLKCIARFFSERTMQVQITISQFMANFCQNGNNEAAISFCNLWLTSPNPLNHILRNISKKWIYKLYFVNCFLLFYNYVILQFFIPVLNLMNLILVGH